MATLLKFASVLFGVVSLNAQVMAILNRFPARSSEIEIRNNSTVTLMAFAVSMVPIQQGNADSPPFIVFVDAVVSTDRISSPHQLGAAMPLPPNQKCVVPVAEMVRGGRRLDLYEPPITLAGVFADGSTTGDAALLSRLVSRRASILQAVELAHEILSDSGKHNVPPSQFIQRFRSTADSLNHWYLPPEQQVGRVLYESIIEKLMNLPQQQVGSAFPPTDFVEQAVRELNRQRVALLESQPSLGTVAGIVPTRR